MNKEGLLGMHMAISCFIMWGSEKIGLRCLAGIKSMDGYIDFGMETPRKPSTSLFIHTFLVAHFII